ncbi:response regulator [Dongia deserti]|uniref:response regulator n=1 Tax=Dongia deserti TaxID=2268030 RepID=UPI000E64CFF0|nr:response regulator [Dongia deserti]
MRQGTLVARSSSLGMSKRSRRPQRGAKSAQIILVVETDVLVRVTVAEYIRECGYKVYEAVSAAEALEVLRAGHKVDVVLSDVRLGDAAMDGFALAQQIRQEFSSVETILTSGLVMTVQKAGELCDQASLEKPYHHEQLLSRLSILFQKRERSRTT